MKIALVHDYLREYGGAERVVKAMHKAVLLAVMAVVDVY